MKFERKFLTDLHRCYATSSVTINGEEKILVATEGEGSCFMYDSKTFEQSTVWNGPGGTMSIVPIPKREGEFLAVQNFFPTFQAEVSQIVWGKYIDGKWEIKVLFKLPYLHRFDILDADGKLYFIGAILCNSKKFKDDWSDPGKICVSEIPNDLTKPFEFRVIKEGLTKNHGYCRARYNGKVVSYVTSQEGVFRVIPPYENNDWRVEKVIDRPTSDVAVIDIDEDGEDELVTIEEFHGKHFRINKKCGNEYKIIYEYEKKMDFGHVVWGGKLRGIPTIIGGYRREDKDLFYIQCVDKEKLIFDTKVIESGVGPSNVHVINEKDRDIIISANREVGQAVLYIVTE